MSGLRVWDASGSLQLDISTRMGRVLGIVSTGTSAGSVSNAGFSGGTPCFAVLRKASCYDSGIFGTPAVSISGTTVSWSFPSPPSGTTYTYQDCFIVYGVY